MDIRELRQRRSKLLAEARKVVEERSIDGVLGAEDQAHYDKLFDEANAVGENVRRLEALEAEERALPAPAGATEMAADVSTQKALAFNETPQYRSAFSSFLRGGWNGLGPAEHRALQSDINTAGGYLVTPMQFVNSLIKAVDNMVYIRQWATGFQVPNAQSLGAPSLENDPADPTWTAEIATGTEDSTMSFGRRELTPKPLAKRIKVSNKTLRQVPDVEMLVVDRLAYKFAVTMEANYLTGSGAAGPLGVFTASDDGITTARDVSTGNGATAPTFDGLIEAKYTLKQQYWAASRWLMHRDVVKVIAKLVDGNGQYIWRESVRVGEPDFLLGLPVFMSEYAPNTLTASQYVGILGDFRYYYIADALDMQVQRLVELYAESNQTGLIGRMESDGMPVLSEAFVRVKLAAG